MNLIIWSISAIVAEEFQKHLALRSFHTCHDTNANSEALSLHPIDEPLHLALGSMRELQAKHLLDEIPEFTGERAGGNNLVNCLGCLITEETSVSCF